jgi:hypothetical protein
LNISFLLFDRRDIDVFQAEDEADRNEARLDYERRRLEAAQELDNATAELVGEIVCVIVAAAVVVCEFCILLRSTYVQSHI